METATLFELGTSLTFLILGAWATAFGWGCVGDRLLGRFQWDSNFKRSLRWLGPLLVLVSAAALLLSLQS